MCNPEKTVLVLLLAFLLGLAAANPDADAIAELARSVSNLPPSWSAGGDVCGYAGLTCEKSSGRVTAIDLRYKGLGGTLPPSMSSLAALRELHLGGNALAGAVPSLAGLTSLARLVLDGNSFTSLPPDFLQDVPSLRDLSLDLLPLLLPWSLPSEYSLPRQLENFSASAASLTGPLPPNLPASLRTLRLTGNNLSGPIDAVASLHGLTLLLIDHNSFSGPIPDLSGILELETFSARDNLLTGPVPVSMTTKMPSLRRVSLSNNFLQGPMPDFGHRVDADLLAGNLFCHPEPGRPCDAQLTTMLQLAAGFGYPLQLARNWHANTTCPTNPTWVGVTCNGTHVTEISLERMNLSGTISPALANLTALVKLNLSHNHLTGVLPDVLATMPHLALIDVSNNNLTGQIPKFKPSVQVMAQGNRFGEPSAASSLNVGTFAHVILALVLAWW